MFALVVGALADTMGFSPLFAALAVFDVLAVVVIWTVLQNRPAIEPTIDPIQQAPAGQN